MAKLITPHGFTVLVDREDIPKIKQYNLQDHFYLICQKMVNGQNIVRWLHHVVLDIEKIEKGSVVDHVNGNPLDCRKRNLRVCTIGQNNLNRRSHSGRRYKGVRCIRFRSGRVRFQARVQIGERFWNHLYDSEKEAVEGYNRKARELHGEFARINVWRGPSFPVKKAEIKARPMGVLSHWDDCECSLCRRMGERKKRKRRPRPIPGKAGKKGGG